MKILHVKVSKGEKFLIGQGLEEPGVLTQGKTLDDLVHNLRDAAELLTGESNVYIELALPADLVLARRGPSPRAIKAA